MGTTKISINQARTMVLHAQGLLTPPIAVATKNDVLAAIKRMAALQIDTINVVARSPYFVLWSRLGHYDPRWLDELLEEGALFEYWSRAACFLPIEDYPLYRPAMLGGWAQARAWLEEHPDEAARIRDRLREQGAVRSADFVRTDGKSGSWWNWKPEKWALDCLYLTGELMIARRDRNFQRVYDLRERVLPRWDDGTVGSAEETRRALTMKAVMALGVARPGWVHNYFGTPRKGIVELLAELAREGALIEVAIDGLTGPSYVHPDHGEALRAALRADDDSVGTTTLLSPFDPIVWDRARAQELFNFGYRIETYTPAGLRKYGYFSLPILHRNALVGRLDAKAHRREGRFEIRTLHWEEGVSVTDDVIVALAQTLRSCASWHLTPEVAFGPATDPAIARRLLEAPR